MRFAPVRTTSAGAHRDAAEVRRPLRAVHRPFLPPPPTRAVPRRRADHSALGRHLIATLPVMVEIGRLLVERPPAGWSLADLQRCAPPYADATTVDRLAEGLRVLEVCGFVAAIPVRRTGSQRRRDPAHIRYHLTSMGFWLPTLPIALREHAPQQTKRALAEGRLLWEGVSPRAQVGWESFLWTLLQVWWLDRARSVEWSMTRHPVLTGACLDAALPRRDPYPRRRMPRASP